MTKNSSPPAALSSSGDSMESSSSSALRTKATPFAPPPPKFKPPEYIMKEELRNKITSECDITGVVVPKIGNESTYELFSKFKICTREKNVILNMEEENAKENNCVVC